MRSVRGVVRTRGLDVLTVAFLGMAAYQFSAPLRQQWAVRRATAASVAAAKRTWGQLLEFGSALADDKSPVRIVEISDYECPFCRKASAAVDSATRSGVQIAYIHYPLRIHPHAEAAAIAALCAEASGRFREMHARLMSSTEWQTDSNWVREAKAAGVTDIASFEKCRSGAPVRARLASERALADSLGVHGTPTFVTRSSIHDGTATVKELRDLSLP
jgi:protein-disulfide isomerase